MRRLRRWARRHRRRLLAGGAIAAAAIAAGVLEGLRAIAREEELAERVAELALQRDHLAY
jgi:hypothetical protein